MELKKSNW